ncbi:MAG: hypothetical protein SCH71_15260 [Desulfobulbaceae bacterium]|nr:hypothetical protein [Desulfobulbaceae bacterium]
MRIIKIKFPVICLMMVVSSLVFSQASASSRDRVLTDVNITRTEQHIVIKVGFNFPVRYLAHYPLGSGKELNIQLDPILTAADDVSGLNTRESLSVPDNNPAGLARVEYEGSDFSKPTLRIVLDKTRNYDVKQGDDFRSLEILLPVQVEAKRDKDAGQAGEKIRGPRQQGMMMSLKRQEDLLTRGKAAMDDKEHMRAILIYTELLDSSDPEVREFAQFQLATAQEYEEHLAHARAEYKNYLETYPEGRYVDQARARLKDLMGDRPIWLGTTEDIPAEAGLWQHEYFGSVSVYYDRDESLYEDDEDIENLSSLTTGFDATWRSRNDKFAAEAVAVGSYELSFLDRRDDHTRVNRLYIDFEDTEKTFTSRLGRQSSSKGGVLTRFDGGRFGYRITEKIRMNLVAGFPFNLSYDDLETDKYFYGINFDLGRFFGHWDFNTYFINQISDDIDDRRAVGGEARYVGQSGSLYSLLDFDILHDEVSVFLVTGNYLLPNNRTRINILADFRGVPILSTSNALIGQASPSLEELEESIGEDELRRLAEDRTLDSSFATVGISQTLTQNLQITGDLSWAKIDGAPASGGVEAFESTGDEFFYSLQLIGSGLIKEGDISSVGVRYGDTQYRDTYTLTLNTRYPFYNKLWLNPRMRIDYRENKLRAGDQWRFIPGLRLDYRLAENWRFEIDGEYRYADEELPGIADGKDGYAVTAGFRWDF